MPFEHSKDHLAPLSVFITRLMTGIGLGIFAICIALFIGMLGYHVLEHMAWIDAFLNASMILSGMGPVGTLSTNAGKLFAGFYALFSGLAFIMIMGVIFAPVVHRFLHKLHLPLERN